MIAGGTGITPMLQVIQEILRNKGRIELSSKLYIIIYCHLFSFVVYFR